MNIENGFAELVTREQYQMGVTTGMFVPPQLRPVYGKKQYADLGELFKQKLREKFVEDMADRAMKDPESKELVTTMFMNQLIHEQTRPDNDDVFSKLVSRLRSLF